MFSVHLLHIFPFYNYLITSENIWFSVLKDTFLRISWNLLVISLKKTSWTAVSVCPKVNSFGVSILIKSVLIRSLKPKYEIKKANTWDDWVQNKPYLFKVNKSTTKTLKKCETCSKLTIKTPHRCLMSFWCLYC